MRHSSIVAAILFAGTLAHPVSSKLAGLGVMGDSLSDEYAEGNYNYSLNWVQQLVMFRDVQLGPTAGRAGQPAGTWGEPRRTQYEQNWARSGANSVDLLDQAQHIGLALQIEPLGISHAVLAIGANDFAPVPLPGFAYFGIYWNNWTPAMKQSYITNVANRIAVAMDTVLAEGVDFVLANVPDYGVTPIAQQFFPDPDRRENVTAVINDLNAIIEDMAVEREIVLIDIAALATAIFGTNHSLNEVLVLGNVEIYLAEADTTSNTNPQAAFVHDSIHPHTTLQGVFANLMIEAMNIGYGANLVPFSEEEILTHAGLSYGGTDTLAEQIGDLGSYVLDFTPEVIVLGDLNGDGVVDVFDLIILINEWGACSDPDDCPADLNGDGIVDVFDLIVLINNWG